jgi:ribonuclease Y
MAELGIGLFLGLLIGAGAAVVFFRHRARQGLDSSRSEADRIISEAEAQSETLRRQAELDAQESKLKSKEDFEKEVRNERAEIQRIQDRMAKREESVERKAELIASRESELTRKEKALDNRLKSITDKETHADKIVEEAREKLKGVEGELERVAGLTADQARKELIEKYVDEARHSAAIEAKHIEDEAREEAEKRAKRLVSIAVQRFAGEYVQERAVTAVELPSDDMKGRIIGREGRNIRAIEAACGVDLVIDDTPETVVISGFDPVRREVARVALERLIADGRIHPTRIEEIVTKAREEVERSMRETGDQAILELGLSRINGELVRLLGSLRYRYSYAQNVLNHSIETGFIAGLLAAELKMNVKQARRAGLLHDIGKAVSHEQEGSHAVVGAQIARKYGESPLIVNAIASHHEDEPPESVLAHLVAASDALSGARPGARREMLETYIKRLEALERICHSFPGVEKSYAVQAGREVRVMVESERMSDADARLLCREIAKKVEDELTYPGQIRVTVIRETRAIEYAR